MTPSSSRIMSKRDTFTTPQRVSVAPQPRMSLAGTASKRMSGRGSQMGARTHKDTRPLTDKEYQKEETRKILDFLREQKYGNTSLTTKHFPLTSKEFVSVFNFLYNILDSQFINRLPSTKFEEEALRVLKGLNYPGNLTKSSFVTMGSLHSWPTVLGALSYLCNLAKIYRTKLLPTRNFNAIAFPSVDDDGMPIDRTNKNKIHLDYYFECFDKFNKAIVDSEVMEYDEENQQLFNELMENQDVDIDYIRSIRSQRKEKEAEYQALVSQKSNRGQLEEHKNALAVDVGKLNEFNKNLQKRINERHAELEQVPRNQEILLAKSHETQAEVADLRSKCTNPNTNHFEAERNAYKINEVRRKIESVKEDILNEEKKNWELEMKYSKCQNSIAGIIRQFNSHSLEANLRNEDGGFFKIDDFRLTDLEDYDGIKIELVDALKQAKLEHRTKEKDLAKSQTYLEETGDKMATLRKNLHEKKAELASITEEIAKSKSHIASEEKALDERLTEARDNLLALKADETGGHDKLHGEIEAAKRRLEEARRMRCEREVKGQEFLKKVVNRTVTYIEQCEDIEKRTSTSLINQIKRSISEIKLTTEQVEKKCSQVGRQTKTT